MVEEKKHELPDKIKHEEHGPREHHPEAHAPKGHLEKHVDELLIRISGNKETLNGVRQVIIEFKNNELRKELPKPPKEERGKVLCAKRK